MFHHPHSGNELYRGAARAVRRFLVAAGPDRPFSGRLMLRLPSEVHRKVYVRAKTEGKSLNQWVVEQLAKAS